MLHVPLLWVGLFSWWCKSLALCHYRPQEERKSSIQSRLLIFSCLHCIATLRSALSNILQVNSLPLCILLLQSIVPANYCTKPDCSAHLLMAQTAGEGLLAFLVPHASFCSGAAETRSPEFQEERKHGALLLDSAPSPHPLKAIP